MRFTFREISQATEGTLYGDGKIVALGVSVDSRQTSPGNLFVALQGETSDGHEYIDDIQDVASGIMISRPVHVDMTRVRVADTRTGLQDLARHAAGRLNGKIVVVSGSVGKTTTKHYISRILSCFHDNVAETPGNYNSTIGVPVSLCNFPEDLSIAVVEMGMNHPGELNLLGSILPPDILVYTSIQPVHTEFFSSIEDVARAKAELIRHLQPEGVLIYNADDPRLRHMVDSWPGKRVSYGTNHADVTGKMTADRGFLGGTLRVRTPSREVRVSVPPGNMHPENLLAAIATGMVLDLSVHHMGPCLSELTPLEHRGRIFQGIRNTRVVDDCYNASPAAMKSALKKFMLTSVKGKRILVLGDMLELGNKEHEYHREIGTLAANVVDLIVSVGPLAHISGEEAARKGILTVQAKNSEEAAKIIVDLVSDGDWIFVKGSRAVGLEKVVNALVEVS